MECSDKIRIKSVIPLATILTATLVYIILYNGSSKVFLGQAFGKTKSGQLKVIQATVQREETSQTGIRDQYSNRLPESIVIKLDRDSIVNVNITLSNKTETLRKVLDMLQGISETKEVGIQNKSSVYKKGAASANKQNRRKKSFLTLFTTWSYNPMLLSIHNNTVNNWASFYPIVTCIVFSNDSRIANVVLPRYWKVQEIRKFAVNDIPVLKYMYIEAMEMFESEFYAYANADILFTDGLISTLMMLRYYFSSSTEPMMITGQRWNIINVSAEQVNPKKNLASIVSDKGSLFHTWAADYFICNREYPWDNVDDLIIGSRAFDNWLILQSRKMGHMLIDATQTILAVHQSFDTDMYHSHRTNISYYNLNLIESIHGPQLYHQGKVDCIENITSTVNDRIVLQRREFMPEYCVMTP